MIINHPLLGPRDAGEFTYLGDVSMLMRPDGHIGEPTEKAMTDMHDYVHLRDNPAGLHRELWYHEQGDRAWLVVTRDTVTHKIVKVELARDVKRREGSR